MMFKRLNNQLLNLLKELHFPLYKNVTFIKDNKMRLKPNYVYYAVNLFTEQKRMWKNLPPNWLEYFQNFVFLLPGTIIYEYDENFNLTVYHNINSVIDVLI